MLVTCGYLWLRMKLMLMYVELHKYMKVIICLAAITHLHHKLKTQNNVASQYVFDCRRCSCMCSFHCYSQLLRVYKRILWFGVAQFQNSANVF